MTPKETRLAFLKANKRAVKRSKRWVRRYGILSANIALIFVVGFFVWQSQSKAENTTHSSSSSVSENVESSGPVDTISAADIATNVAYATSLPQKDNVRSQADSLNVSLAITAPDEVVVAKPQIVQGGSESRKDIITYTVKAGDTVSSIAKEFNVSSDSIRWSNDISGEKVNAGAQLLLPPRNRNGIVYKVKAGDTIEAVANKFSSTKEKIENFNDTEISGLPVNEYILIPDGSKQAEPVYYGSTGSSGFFSSNPTYGGNSYSFGYCTFWVAKRRIEIGRPIPSNWGNADAWDDYARAQGYVVDKTPEVGAIVQAESGAHWYLYHVAFIEAVYDNGDVLVSQMNVAGWNRVSQEVIPAGDFQRFAGLDIIH